MRSADVGESVTSDLAASFVVPARGRPLPLVLLGRVRMSMLLVSAEQLLRTPAKLLLVISAWTVLLVGIYILCHQGLRFFYDAAGFGPFLVDRLWYLFLFVVAVLLGVSQLASAYSTLIRAGEMSWWVSLPLSARTISRAKWLESSFYSSWAVVLLVFPLGIAHLVVSEHSLWFIGWLIALLIPLMVTITSLSTMTLLVWLRWCGRLGRAVRQEALAVGLVVACGVLFWVLGERAQETEQEVWFLALQELLPRMQIAMAPWVPSGWVAKAFGAGLNARWMEGALYAGLLVSTALVAWRLLDHVAARLLMPVLRGVSQPAERDTRAAERIPIFKVRWWMRRPFGASLLKDLLLVIRDPVQWTQGVLFFGLLGAYFGNLHRLGQASDEPSWRIGIAALNFACTLLVFGALAVRFIFPQMSLEGRRLWLLRTMPKGIRRVMSTKLWIYGLIAIGIVEGLLFVSVNQLDVPPDIRWWMAGIGVIAALTLVELTVGLGAWWIDPTTQDPARLVASSSGALVLVFMLGYMGCVILALILFWSSWLQESIPGMVVASLGLATISLATGWMPMHGGLARLERLEAEGS